MKKISPNLLGFLIALAICIGSLWAYFNYIEKEDIQVIDNPTQATLKVKIDNQEYIIAPNQSINVSLNTGEHTINAKKENGAEILPSTTFTTNKKRGLINPTKSVYCIYGMPYGPNVNKDSIYKNLKTKFKEKTYLGDLKIDSSLINEDFYYNITEDYPSMTLKSENETLRKKIFRAADFKQFYFEHYE